MGLGNPGAEFEGTRHNCGAMAVRALAARHGERLRSERSARATTATVRFDGRALVLAVPATYMNESGVALRPLVHRYVADELSRTVIVHDELDLEPGVVRVKDGGGIAGHNGLRSVEQHLHSRAFVRVRIGIGRPRGRSGVDYVLGRPRGEERELIAVGVELAADAVEAILCDGLVAAMNRFNSKP